MNNKKNEMRKTFFQMFNATYIIAGILFIISLVSMLGLRRSVEDNSVTLRIISENSRRKEFDAIVKNAIYMSDYDMGRSAEKIISDINSTIDMKKLENCIENGKEYPEFDAILRSHLGQNIFTKSVDIDGNRNNMFVILNGNLIASYSHDTTYLKSPTKLGYPNNFDNIIKYKNFYNKELGLSALEKLYSQYKGVIIWQARKPIGDVDKYKKYTDMTLKDFTDVMINEDIESLASYDILIPKYITDNGNIFGEFDVAGQDRKSNNKLIIVQKLNMVDWINYIYPDFFETDRTDTVEYNYVQLLRMINIFIIINSITFIGFAIIFVLGYNKIDDLDDNHLETISEV